MIRLRLGSDDLMRTRIARTPDPLLETVGGIQLTRRLVPGSPFAVWRRRFHAQLSPEVRILACLYPTQRAGLDLSTLVGPVEDLDDGLDRLCQAQLGALRAELEFLSSGQRLAPWAASLADRNPMARKQLCAALTAFHDIGVDSYWPVIRACLQADRARRARSLADGGVDHLLATLCPPDVRWDPPMLEIQSTIGRSEEIDLGGRGLVLEPSVLVGERPILLVNLADDSTTPRLVYPVIRDRTAAMQLTATANGAAGLAALLGRSRAAVLQTIAHGCASGEIARGLGLSPAVVSHHTSILRDSGLITTCRDGTTVLHTLTDLGTALLNGGCRPHSRSRDKVDR